MQNPPPPQHVPTTSQTPKPQDTNSAGKFKYVTDASEAPGEGEAAGTEHSAPGWFVEAVYDFLLTGRADDTGFRGFMQAFSSQLSELTTRRFSIDWSKASRQASNVKKKKKKE
jgi:hypothetical protein